MPQRGNSRRSAPLAIAAKPVASPDGAALIPSIQQGVKDAFATLGLDVVKCGTVLSEIMETGDDADKLKAVELFFKVTVGFATTKNANLHQHMRRDAFFDEQTFTAPPQPLLVEHSDD